MAPTSFRTRVRHVQPREAVSAGVDSRPTRDLESQTNYLKNRLDEASLGQVIGRDGVPIGADVFLGAAVYYDVDDDTHRNGLAGVQADTSSGTVIPAKESFIVGICVSKTSQTGKIISAGWVDISDWLENMGVTTPGLYYLSSRDAGKVTLSRPAVGIPVLHYIGSGIALVFPQFTNVGEDHVHFSFRLEPGPAGTLVNSGGHYTITNVDNELRGWLPADDPVFNGSAPTGAMFGYNLHAHEELNQVWPPVPADAVELIWDTGDNREGNVSKTEFIVGAESALVRMDSNGIWWMTDCENDVPWYNLSSGSSSSGSSSSSSGDSCPARSSGPILRLSFARVSYMTARRLVTSLTPGENSPITLKNADGEDATTGDLFVGFDGDFAIDTDAGDVRGSLALKGFSGDKFQRGSITEGLIAGTGVSLTSTSSQTIVVDDEEVTMHQGVITVNADVQPDERILDMRLAFLNGAETAVYQSIPYYSLPNSRTGEITLSIKVPLDNLPTNPKVLLRSNFFTSVTGTVPAVDGYYRVVPRGTATGQALPTSDTAMDTGIGSQSMTAYEYISVDGEEIAVEAGDIIIIRLRRAGRTDGFSGNIGLLDLSAVLYSGE